MNRNWLKSLGTVLAMFLVIGFVGAAIAEDIDVPPSWYHGDKSWGAVSREGREDLLRMHRGFEAYKERANEKSHQTVPADAAKRGERLIHKTQQQYGLHPYYRTASQFGPRMVIWFPRKAWSKFTRDQKASVEAYMSSKYSNWGIGVGRVEGVDIMLDRLVVEH